MIKAILFTEECIKMHKEGYGYVLGGQGEVYSRELAQKWGSMERCGKSYSYFTKTCAKWYGHKIVDCSGMIIEAIRKFIPGYKDNTADGLFAKCVVKGKMDCMPDKPGICVHKKGHIGVYIGDGKVVEAKGASYGVVITDIKDTKWTGWGELCDINYGEVKKEENKFVLTRLLKKRLVLMRGQDVKDVQSALYKAGFDPKGIDGVFGKKHKKSSAAFSKSQRA